MSDDSAFTRAAAGQVTNALALRLAGEVEALERRLEAHHAIAATTEDVLSYHDPRRCPVCAEVKP